MIILLCLFIAAILLLAFAIWQGTREPNLFLSAVAASLVVVCALLVIYGLFLGESVVVRPRYAVERLLGPAVAPVFVLLPALVTFCLAQWLRARARSVKFARVVSGVAGLVACCFAPLGAVAGGCGLAGVCF